jgi:hypothetical protein
MERRRMRDVWGAVILAMGCLGAVVPTGSLLAASEGLLPAGDYQCTGATTSDASLPSDFFSDNQIGSLWRLDGDDLGNCWLDEAHQRLELRSTGRNQWATARYVSDDWGLAAGRDFSLRVDFHYEAKSGDHTWLLVSLLSDTGDPGSRYVDFGVGSDKGYAYFWYEAADQWGTRSKLTSRSRNDGRLYVSYNAGLDELYLSSEGFGAQNAWATVRQFLKGSWGAASVGVALQGGTNLTQVSSGQAHFDNFVVETGSRTASRLSDVYRFWSPMTDAHFFTISKAERDKLIRDYSDVWTFEGVVFRAAKTPFSSGLAPVYRFWSDVTQSHLYTISETEKDKLLREFKDVWTFEGIAFYAYPQGKQPSGTKPVYRFWSNVKTAHFYTISESEKNKFLKDYSDIYIFEGIAFYTYE